MNYNKEASLGDILREAVKRSKVMDRTKVVNFVKAARDTGRSDRGIIDMLESDEITCLLNSPPTVEPTVYQAAKRKVAVQIRYIPSHLQGAKIQLIKMVRAMDYIGLVEAKQFVEGTRTLWMTTHDAEIFRALMGNDAVHING